MAGHVVSGPTHVLVQASRQALQWRLALLWLLAQALPLALLWLPLWLPLSTALDHSLSGRRLLAGEAQASLYIEVVQSLLRQPGVAAGSGGLLILLLQLPWLAGVLMRAASSAERLDLRALIVGGLDQYGRMARLGVWSLGLLGLAAAAGGTLVHLANERGGQLTLESEAARMQHLALALAALLFALVQASLDAARAQLVHEPQRRSVVLAWFRAGAWLIRRPGVVCLYLLLTAAGMLAAASLAWLRVQSPANGPMGLVAAFALGQALALSLGWMRAARLFALVASARVPAPQKPSEAP